ncbi:MAG TPA: hypothetical protein VH500_21525 [Nitrososphaeraceae archaeon]
MKYKIIKLLYFKNYSDHHYSLSLLTLAMLVLFSLISSIPFIISSQFDQIVCNQCRNIAYAQNNSENKNSFSNNVTQQWEDKNANVSSFSALPAGIAIIIGGIVVLAVVIIKTRKPS